MNRLENMSKPLVWSTALLLTAIVAGCGGSTGSAGAPGAQGIPGNPGNPGVGTPGAPGAPALPPAPNAVNLLSAQSYALTTSSGLAISNNGISGAPGSTTFGGNVAMDAPTSACTSVIPNATIQPAGSAVDACGMETAAKDFTNGPITPTNPAGLTITGTTIRYNPGVSNTAGFNASVRAVKNDVNKAWNDAATRMGGTLISGPGALDGLTLTPGTYTSTSTMTLGKGATLTLDAGGNANAVWIFQVGSSLTVTGSTLATCTGGTPVCQPTQVVLKNGALARNVFWAVGSSASFPAATYGAGNNTIFKGIILSSYDVTFAGGTAVEGRVLAGASLISGAVTATAGTTGPVTVTQP